ncbi:tryptophan 2-monooxygenase [Pectobacterium actinidiae]|uniref:Tryptophan 2-monooxygenase n=1 Tax=Pectobacterium actinidiae TaxID=1507808 RepID=A0A1V2R3Y8_9GAMM|nr:NAD(P)/FAD-dependent oxidoreductase [Pectobacterium actinidiae]KHN93272.1 amine oxidase [Pectobacterium actinidiae]ONK06482.1 tryptophan 2-monooxygenase [Pectobacterium actinidiae]ONK06616.1 tryptophan 2-monooxygenase [Pectobacterium actinidiae]
MLKSNIRAINGMPCVDQLFDYAAFLEQIEAYGAIGSFPANVTPPRIAIVGAGLSGLVTAFELLRAGIRDITVFEARDRIGGRIWSQNFDPNLPNLIAEMGAMRFPSSETCLFHYLDKFQIATSSAFPDPGIVDTELDYRGQRYYWPAGEKPPTLFQHVYEGWHALLQEGYTHNGQQLVSPLTITSLLQARRFKEVQAAWQAWIDAFGDYSFYSAIALIFSGDNPPGGKRWKKPDDFALFGSLGIGSGGFLPVYQAGFIEIMRLVVNGYEVDQRLVVGGISRLIDQLLSQNIHDHPLREHVHFRTVKQIDKVDGKIALKFEQDDEQQFDRVIVTSSPRTMQIVHNLTRSNMFFNHDVLRALKETHLTGSSKLFILTRNKFWLQHALPVTIQSDGLVRGVYCLDYEPDNPEGHGVVLLSYTWEDDSHKLLSLTNKTERCHYLTNDLMAAFPEFARHLIPLNNDYDRYVLHHDWLTDPHALGAFKLNYPGEDSYSQRLFFQFQDANSPHTDPGIYLAGCGCSFTGGWGEGAVQTALNSACAVIRSTGGQLVEGNPLDAMQPAYRY